MISKTIKCGGGRVKMLSLKMGSTLSSYQLKIDCCRCQLLRVSLTVTTKQQPGVCTQSRKWKEYRHNSKESRQTHIFTKAKIYKQLKSFSGWMDKENVLYMKNGILVYHKNNKTLQFGTTWIDFDGIMLSELSQRRQISYECSYRGNQK